jgi:hypothetical protein
MSQKSKDKFDERELLSSKYLSLSNKEITTEVLRERLKVSVLKGKKLNTAHRT